MIYRVVKLQVVTIILDGRGECTHHLIARWPYNTFFKCYTLPKKSANRSSSEGLFDGCSADDFCGCGGSTEAVVEAIFPIT